MKMFGKLTEYRGALVQVDSDVSLDINTSSAILLTWDNPPDLIDTVLFDVVIQDDRIVGLLCKEDGVYELQYNVNSERRSSNNKDVLEVFATVNGIRQTRTSSLSLLIDQTYGQSTNGLSVMVSVPKNAEVRVYAKRQVASGVVTLPANERQFNIKRIRPLVNGV